MAAVSTEMKGAPQRKKSPQPLSVSPVIPVTGCS